MKHLWTQFLTISGQLFIKEFSKIKDKKRQVLNVMVAGGKITTTEKPKIDYQPQGR